MTTEIFQLQAVAIDGTEQQTVNARELHAFLEVGKDFSTWIKDRIEKYGFEENIDFVTFSPNLGKTSSGGRPAIEYHISLSMAKELSMVERNTKGKQARQYFIDCERKLKEVAQPAIPNYSNLTKLQILEMAIESEQQKIELQAQNKGLQKQIEEDAPLVSFAQKVSEYGDAVKLDIAAKAVDIPPKKYREAIRHLGWLRNDGHPMQFAIDRGYMKVRTFMVPHSNGIETPSYTPLITGKGQVKAAQVNGFTFKEQFNLFTKGGEA